MLLVVLSVLMAASANGLPVGEKTGVTTPLKYREFPGSGRYLFDPAPQNWTDASKVCRLYNGHLVYPNTQDVANVVWDLMAQFNVTQIHAAFHDQYEEGKYYTSKGRLISEMGFNQWSSGAPNGGSSNNCGGLRRDGLVDVNCKEKLPSICEENQEIGTGVPEGYVNIPGHGYYKYYEENKNWVLAMKTCYNEGSHLWVINSQDEIDAVVETFGVAIYTSWVGVHHLHADRYFVTVFDEPLEKTGYSTWMPGEPSGSQLSYPYVQLMTTGYRINAGSSDFVCELA